MYDLAAWALLPLAADFGSGIGAASGDQPRGITTVIRAVIAAVAMIDDAFPRVGTGLPFPTWRTEPSTH